MNVRPVVLNHYLLFILKCVVMWFGGISTATASIIINEPFNSPVGGIPEGWSKFTSSGTPAIIEVTEYKPNDAYPSGDYRLMIKRDTGGAGGVMYTGTQGDNGIIQDFSISTIFMYVNGSNDGRGIIARAQTTTFAYNGYWAFTKLLDDKQKLAISKNPSALGTNHGTVLASTALSENLTAGTEYLYTFSGIGNLLVAEIYKQDSNGDYTVLLASVSVVDESYSEGMVGFMARPGGNGRSNYIKDFQVTLIPEPMTMSLILGLGITLLLSKRKWVTGMGSSKSMQ